MPSPELDPAQITAADGDLREFIRLTEQTGELVRVSGADPNLEVGALYELSLEQDEPPVLLFDNLKGCSPGYRIVVNTRTAQIFTEGRGLEAVKAYRERRRRVGTPQPIPPEQIETGPVCQNILVGDQVNVLKFPRIRWHEQDGGEYIGTECLVVTKDPDSDWVNVGSYRVQVQDEKTISVFIEHGKHGDVIRRKYWERGQSCPMLVSAGQAPILGRLAGNASKPGESEMATAGGRLGHAIRVVQGQITGLPIPADAELVFEGFMPPPEIESRAEGPFGEWPGYYASTSRPEPVLQVQAIYHRDDLIITGMPPAKPTLPGRQGYIPQSAGIWDALEAAGVPGIKGVWKMQGGGTRFITVIAIAQEHPGHAKMAGLVATGCGPAAYLGRLTVVVDDDIDITNPVEVLWAMATRWDPKTQTDIIDGCWTGHIDPILDPAKRESGDLTNSRMIIYAVRPYHWRHEFPAVNEVPRSYADQVREKWAPDLAFLRATRSLGRFASPAAGPSAQG